MERLQTKGGDSPLLPGSPMRDPPVQQASSISSMMDEDEDNPSREPVPIAWPPPLAVHVGEVVVHGRPIKVLDTLFAADSPLWIKMNKKEETSNMVVGSWADDAPLAASRGCPDAKSRTVTYVKPFAIPLPKAPPTTKVSTVEQLLVREGGGFIMEQQISLDASAHTFCGYFHLIVQWAARSEGPGCTRLRVSLKVHFFKELWVGAREAVDKSVAVANKRRYAAWIEELVKDLGSPKPEAAGAPITTASSGGGGAAAGEGALVTFINGAVEKLMSADPVQTLRSVLLVLLLIGLVYFTFGVWSACAALRGLVDAVAASLVQQPGGGQQGELDALAGEIRQALKQLLSS